MTYEQFWYGDPRMARAYAQAYLLRRKVQNENMWIQGAYFANAIAVALNNAFDKKKKEYLKEPLDIFPKTEAEIAAEKRAERKKLINFLSGMKKAFTHKANTGVDQDGKP